MDPGRFLSLAQLLKGGTCEPENCRTSISRAYYAAFNTGVSAFDAVGILLPKNANAHGQMVACLDNSKDNDFIKVARRLKSLREQRNVADYDLSALDPENQKTADFNYREAAQLIIELKKLESQTCNYAIIANMKQYATSRGWPVN
jgi:hypothetical protein